MAKPMDKVNQSPDADAVFDALHDVMHLYRAQARATAAGTAEVSPLEARALGFFVRQPGATLSDLAAHSGRDKSQLARLVGGLRERGLLTAQVDEDDRRNVRLHPTEDALALHRAMRARMRQRARAAIAGLQPRECEQLLALLARIRGNLERAG